MSLVAAELERRGITTVCLMLLRSVAEKVRPPRSLLLPFRHGYPLGEPHDPTAQRAVLEAALRVIEGEAGPPPVFTDYPLSR